MIPRAMLEVLKGSALYWFIANNEKWSIYAVFIESLHTFFQIRDLPRSVHGVGPGYANDLSRRIRGTRKRAESIRTGEEVIEDQVGGPNASHVQKMRSIRQPGQTGK